MPTFSYPTPTPAVTVVKPSRGAAKKKNAKGSNEEVKTIPETIAESKDYVETSAEESTLLPTVVEPEPEPELEPEPEQEYVHREPTFPDVVILKQTDKNYIVKHNHYSIPVKTSANIHDISMVGGGGGDHAEEDSSADIRVVGQTVLASTTDLVSPNQIYKGQINKKRGRKPKAGIILNSNTGIYDTSEVPNIILHLKCHLSDLKSNESISNFDYTPSISEVESYNLSSNLLKSSEIIHSYNSDTNDNDDDSIAPNEMNTLTKTTTLTFGTGAATHTHTTHTHAHTSIAPATVMTATPMTQSSSTTTKKNATEANIQVINERHQKEIMKKINRLKYSFHNGETIQMKLNHKSACFWDTCEFDGPIYYIPIMVVNGVFHVSGCFCSPECALASLLKEQMDTSTKFERIHLLHLLYGNSNSTGFKPAPNPNYLLDKYYGNLTIDEFRSLFKGPQMIHVVNKPLTHILPELYEDNNDFLVNSKVIPTNTLKLKKRYKTTLVQHSSTAD